MRKRGAQRGTEVEVVVTKENGTCSMSGYDTWQKDYRQCNRQIFKYTKKKFNRTHKEYTR